MNIKISNLTCPTRFISCLLLPAILLLAGHCEGKRILIYFLQGSYSQLNVLHPYGVKLAEAGHDVTFLIGQPYKTPHPKIVYIIPEDVHKKVNEFETLGPTMVIARESNLDIDRGFKFLPGGGLDFCTILLSNKTMVDWIDSTTFDLVVSDSLFNECGIAIAYKINAPYILFETCTVMPWQFDTFGLPTENSHVPDIRKNFPHDMTFLQRVYNALYTLEFYFLYRQWYYLPTLDAIVREKLMLPNMPSLAVLEKNASLVFVNSHFSAEVARSLPPLFVQVGGLQCSRSNEPSQLPNNIADFIKRFPAGFIYISFGTVCQLPDHLQNTFLSALSSHKFAHIGFIMKWNGDIPVDDSVPPNVLLVPWAPQKELLDNPHIKGFLSHGGMLSTQESVFYKVPVIGIPVFAEQDYNVECLRRLGAAIKLEMAGLTKEQLENAFQELLTDNKYAKAIKRISELHHDRPQHPLDTALYWTEYVLRHHENGNGLDHLKPLAINQYWFQRRLLDVWAFIFFVTFSTIFGTVFLVWKIVRFFCSKFLQNSPKHKAKIN